MIDDFDMPLLDRRMSTAVARWIVVSILCLACVCGVAVGGVFLALCVFAIRWLLGW